jgi:hypothetical protein
MGVVNFLYGYGALHWPVSAFCLSYLKASSGRR